jgi:hypothetical protein
MQNTHKMSKKKGLPLHLEKLLICTSRSEYNGMTGMLDTWRFVEFKVSGENVYVDKQMFQQTSSCSIPHMEN